MDMFVMLMKQRNLNRRGNQHGQERYELNKKNKLTINMKFLNIVTFHLTGIGQVKTGQEESRDKERTCKFLGGRYS